MPHGLNWPGEGSMVNEIDKGGGEIRILGKKLIKDPSVPIMACLCYLCNCASGNVAV